MMKSKKGLLLLFIVQLILVLSLGVSAADAAPASDVAFTVEAPSAVKAGDTFKVTVSISENKGFALAIPKLTYDPDVLTFNLASSVAGKAFPDVSITDSVKLVENENAPGGVLEVADPGRISMSVGSLGTLSAIKAGEMQPFTATGVVAELTFTAKASAEDYVLEFVLDTANNVVKPNGTIDVALDPIALTVNVVGTNHQHTDAIDAAVPATCTETGLTEGKHCSFCGVVLTAQKDVPAFGHNYTTSTSNGDGTHTKVCANDATHTEIENCAGGTATCEDKAVCDVCKAEYGEALGHTPGAAATCVTAQTCSVCNKELAPATGVHTAVVIPAVEATETSEGSTEGSKCSVCDAVLVAPETVPMLEPAPEPESTLWIWIVVIVAVVVVAGAVVAVIVIKKKKSN